MLRKFLLILSIIFNINAIVNCMGINEQIIHFKEINQILKNSGLLPDLCKIIGQYVGWRIYHQFDKNNGVNTNEITNLKYLDNIKCLASVDTKDNASIKIWDLDSKNDTYLKCLATFEKCGSSLEYIPDIKCIASGSNAMITSGSYPGISIFDLDKSSNKYLKCMAKLKINSQFDWILSLAYILDIKCLVSGSAQGKITVWDLDKKSDNYLKSIAIYDRAHHLETIWTLAYLNESKYLASAGTIIKLWSFELKDKSNLKCIATFDRTNNGHTNIVWALEFLPDIKCLASASTDNSIKLWNLEQNNDGYLKCIASVDRTNGGHGNSLEFINNYVTSLAYLPDIKCLFSSGFDSNIKLWDLDKDSQTYFKCIFSFDKASDGCHTDKIKTLVYCKNIKYLISGGYDKTIKIWINMKDFLGNFNFVNNPIDNNKKQSNDNSGCIVC